MGEFFLFMIRFLSGWRRKFGILSLVLACLFLGAWARSLMLRDVYALTQDSSTIVFRSFQGGFGWQRFTPTSSFSSMGWQSDYNFKFSISDPWWRLDNFEDDEIDWRWNWGGFSFGSATKKQPEFLKRHLELWIVPYWPFAIPLTLLAPYLLFAMPQIRNQRKLTEPTPVEGT